MIRRAAALLLALAAAACSSGTPSADTPVPAGSGTPVPAGSGTPGPRPAPPSPGPSGIAGKGDDAPPDLADLPLAPGRWFARDGGALFGVPDSEPVFLIECDADAHVLYIDREGELAKPGTLTLAAGGTTRSWPVPATEESELPTIEASVQPDDPFLPVLAGATGRIAVRVGRGDWLVMPADPAIGAAVRACMK